MTEIFENTNEYVRELIAEFGGDDPERFQRKLQYLVKRVKMDLTNIIQRGMAEAEEEIKDLPKK